MSGKNNKNNEKPKVIMHPIAPGIPLEEAKAQVEAMIKAKHGEEMKVTFAGASDAGQAQIQIKDLPDEVREMMAKMASGMEGVDDEENEPEKKGVFKKIRDIMMD